MGNALTQGVERIVVEDDSPLKDYKNGSVANTPSPPCRSKLTPCALRIRSMRFVAATVRDYNVAKSNFDGLQETVGDKMTLTEDEFDEIFSLICQDSSEHFKLFDCWDLGKVDVMEVFAVVIVYAKCSMDEKIPLLFDLFDFDHSKAISQTELVLLMLCTTRGLCKVVGLDRPDPAELEQLAQAAFTSIDRDHDGQISLSEFTHWALQEPSLMVYLKRFASARLIYDNQLQYDELMKQVSDAFVRNATPVVDTRGRKQLACDGETCAQLIQARFPATTASETAYLVSTMRTQQLQCSSYGAFTRRDTDTKSEPPAAASSKSVFITMDVFCLVLGSYVAFVVADEDAQHVVDLKELKVLLWLMRGKEPSITQVASVMKSLDTDDNGVLSALEWVSYALASDAASGGQLSLATQIQLLFVRADQNGDAQLSIQELIHGLKPLLLDRVLRSMDRPPSRTDQDRKLDDPAAHERDEAIHALITALANELMAEMDKNQSHRLEWFEFRQHVDFLHERVQHTKAYLHTFVLGETTQQLH